MAMQLGSVIERRIVKYESINTKFKKGGIIFLKIIQKKSGKGLLIGRIVVIKLN